MKTIILLSLLTNEIEENVVVMLKLMTAFRFRSVVCPELLRAAADEEKAKL